MSNENLMNAKRTKNDEFYTLYEDVEKELIHYKEYLKGKSVYCPCDDPRKSNFWKYLHEHFEEYGLKKLTATYLAQEGDYSRCVEYCGGNDEDTGCWKQHSLEGTGGFETDECKAIMNECDIVITNPPFSLWRVFFKQIMDISKDLLILGSLNAITYKEVFPYIKDNRLALGYSGHVSDFLKKDGSKYKFGNIYWFTTLPVIRDVNLLEELSCKYYGNEDKYPKYDNYDAINVDKVKEIPVDYEGVMGVPITFLEKYNSGFDIVDINPHFFYSKDDEGKKHKQLSLESHNMKDPYARLLIKKNPEFEQLGIMNTGEENPGIRLPNTEHGRPVVNGEEKYLRVLIKRTKEDDECVSKSKETGKEDDAK